MWSTWSATSFAVTAFVVLYMVGAVQALQQMESTWKAEVSRQLVQLSSMARVGRFDRLEVLTPDGRIVCQVRPDRRVFVRSAAPKTQVP